jgi:hypothetical protein
MTHKEPKSATCGGVGTAVPQTPRAISWRARVGDEPEASPVWLLALLLDGSYLALTKQKQQANQRPDARYVSLVRPPFCVGTAVPSESSQKFLDLQKLGPQEKTRKNKILLTSIHVHHRKHVLNGRF